MANYLLLFTGGGMAATPALQAASLKEWEAWYVKLGAATVDAGNPFTAAAKNIGAGGKVSSGPVGTMATGYSVIKADSLDAAVALAKGCPIIKDNGQVTVYETMKAM